MRTQRFTSNLYEWFDAIEFYKTSSMLIQEKRKLGLEP